MDPVEPEVTEPVEPAGGVAPAAEPVVESPAEPGGPAAEPVDAGAEFVKLVEDVFAEDKEAGHDPAALAASLTREQLAAMPLEARAAVRALAGVLKPRMDKLSEREVALAEKERTTLARLDEGMAELRRRSLALQKAVNFDRVRAAAGEKAPEGIDPTTPDGLRKLAAHEARKAAAEGVLDLFKDVEQTRVQAQRESFEDELRGKYPGLKDEKTTTEFMAFLQKENEGVKGPPWRVDAATGARLFFAERSAQDSARKAAEAAANEAADRAASARAMNRATAAGAGRRQEGIPDDVYQRGGVTAYLQSLSPAERSRVVAAERARLQ
jgi:hypothetical protein